MKFSAKEDIEAPVDRLFDILSEFENFERSAIRRGIEVERLDTLGRAAVGAKWQAKVHLRGKKRNVRGELVEYDRPNSMRFQTESSGIDGLTDRKSVV